MALLAALCALSENKDFNFKFSVFHVEHGLREPKESRGDSDFVRDFCENRGIKCRIKCIAPGKIASFAQKNGTGIEAAARYFRHRALRREAERIESCIDTCQGARNYKKVIILLAHTKDDFFETALMRVLCGAGPAGLSAMKSGKDQGNGERRENKERRTEGARCFSYAVIARPLLEMTRGDVVGYLTEKNISWREDSTNSDDKFLRNRIRHRLVPVLNEFFPEWKTGVASVADTQSLVNDFLAGEAGVRIKWELIPMTSQCAYVSTEEENFFSQPKIIREEAVFMAVNLLSSFHASESIFGNIAKKSIKRSVVRQFCEGEVNAFDLGTVRIYRENGRITMSQKQKEFFESGISRLIKDSGCNNL